MGSKCEFGGIKCFIRLTVVINGITGQLVLLNQICCSHSSWERGLRWSWGEAQCLGEFQTLVLAGSAIVRARRYSSTLEPPVHLFNAFTWMVRMSFNLWPFVIVSITSSFCGKVIISVMSEVNDHLCCCFYLWASVYRLFIWLFEKYTLLTWSQQPGLVEGVFGNNGVCCRNTLIALCSRFLTELHEKQLQVSSSWIINGVQSKQSPLHCSEYLNSINCFEKLSLKIF